MSKKIAKIMPENLDKCALSSMGDVNLRYFYRGLKTGERGRPQKFAGKVLYL